jgi:hypothetical protein
MPAAKRATTDWNPDAEQTSADIAQQAKATGTPHSWELETWPLCVWPHDQKRARWILRAYRQELVAAGALTRIGKTLVVVGTNYTRWQTRRAKHVAEFAGNNPAIRKAAEPARA